jgi:hypothetical protein
MKKFLVAAVVLAIACMSSMAFAADVTINGYFDIRSRNFQNFDLNNAVNVETSSRQTTETSFRLDVNVKASDTAKAKLSLWNDHEAWAGNNKNNPDNQTNMNNNGPVGTDLSSAQVREAWIDIMIPDTPVGIKAGHQLLQIGNGWFFRQNYGGTDAWIVYAKMGNNTFAFQDVKFREGNTNSNQDDVDLYTAMATMKMGDKTLGIDLSAFKDNTGVYLLSPVVGANGQHKGRLYNVGLHFNGKVGPAALKVEADAQQGMVDDAVNGHIGYSGNQVVAQATMPMDKLTVNATAARGTGNVSGQNKVTQFSNISDIGQHYTLIYEYRIKSAAGATNTMFTNTTALEVGAMFQATKSVAVGADLWFLRATEQVALNGAAEKSRDLGTELDVKVNWTLAPGLTWNWQIGYFKPGAAYNTAAIKADPAYGAQGILSLTF